MVAAVACCACLHTCCVKSTESLSRILLLLFFSSVHPAACLPCCNAQHIHLACLTVSLAYQAGPGIPLLAPSAANPRTV